MTFHCDVLSFGLSYPTMVSVECVLVSANLSLILHPSLTFDARQHDSAQLRRALRMRADANNLHQHEQARRHPVADGDGVQEYGRYAIANPY